MRFYAIDAASQLAGVPFSSADATIGPSDAVSAEQSRPSAARYAQCCAARSLRLRPPRSGFLTRYPPGEAGRPRVRPMLRSEIAAPEMTQGADPGARASGRLSRQEQSVWSRPGLAPQRAAISCCCTAPLCATTTPKTGSWKTLCSRTAARAFPSSGRSVTARGTGKNTALPSAIEPARAPTCSSTWFGGLCRFCLRPH